MMVIILGIKMVCDTEKMGLLWNGFLETILSIGIRENISRSLRTINNGKHI
jgi:hypothetical protein